MCGGGLPGAWGELSNIACLLLPRVELLVTDPQGSASEYTAWHKDQADAQATYAGIWRAIFHEQGEDGPEAYWCPAHVTVEEYVEHIPLPFRVSSSWVIRGLIIR